MNNNYETKKQAELSEIQKLKNIVNLAACEACSTFVALIIDFIILFNQFSSTTTPIVLIVVCAFLLIAGLIVRTRLIINLTLHEEKVISETEIEGNKPQKKRRGGMKFRRILGDTAGQIFLTILSIIWIIPLFYLVVQSFRKEPGAWSPTFFPQEWTLDNYKRLFTETPFLQWYGNTLLIAICSCIITALFVLCTAYAFSRMKFKARKPMMNIMLILGMFPGFMSMSAVYFLLKILLPTNYQSHLSLILVYSAGAALSYYIAKGFFDTVPKSLDEAARIDGASRFRTFYKIILPLSKSIVIYTILTSFISPWCDYIFVSYIMAGVPDTGMYTVSLGMYKWLEREMIQQYFTTFCAAAVIVATPITGLFMWLQKYYVEGVTGGAVKG